MRGNAFESLTAITHASPQSVKLESKTIQKQATALTAIDPSLIKEVDLGCFKHKVDEGVFVRKAAYGLIETMIEKIPERVEAAAATEVAIKGLDDTAEECMIQSLSILHRLVLWSPIIVVTHIDSLIDQFTKLFQKNMPNIAANDKSKNIMRSVIRVIEQLSRTQEIDGNTRFAEFFKQQIQDSNQAREIFQNIAATASQAVFNEHF